MFADPKGGGARATLTFTLAISLQAMGADVAVYLNKHAAIWAFQGVTQSIHIPGFDNLQTYIDLFLTVMYLHPQHRMIDITTQPSDTHINN